MTNGRLESWDSLRVLPDVVRTVWDRGIRDAGYFVLAALLEEVNDQDPKQPNG